MPSADDTFESIPMMPAMLGSSMGEARAVLVPEKHIPAEGSTEPMIVITTFSLQGFFRPEGAAPSITEFRSDADSGATFEGTVVYPDGTSHRARFEGIFVSQSGSGFALHGLMLSKKQIAQAVIND